MRLGIRRKLIGTLMLVGLFPLAMSLIVILGGGAFIQLETIRGKYEDTAAKCSEQISDVLLHEELEKLLLESRLEHLENFVQQHGGPPAFPGAAIPTPSAEATRLDQAWPQMAETDPRLAPLLHNEVAERFRLLTAVDKHARLTQITNAAGELIAADGKTDDFFQADEEWWQKAFNGGKGRLYISSITSSTGEGPLKPGDQTVVIAFPLFTVVNGKTGIIGIVKDEMSVSWLLRTLEENAQGLHALMQLVDHTSGTTVYAIGGDQGGPGGAAAKRSQTFYFKHGMSHPSVMKLLLNNLVLGAAPVDIGQQLETVNAGRFEDIEAPDWGVVVSKPSEEAMTPVYKLAGIVAAIGVALILVLFILGVAISNREIIMPVLRLREATAAVGRGELNVRLLSGDVQNTEAKSAERKDAGGKNARQQDATFRKDELGDLARDFDEMTRQLQRNVNQLAKSNEAKRRFMELAGHELRTPVTYLLGVCYLAQKQLDQIAAAATDGKAESEEEAALAVKNTAAVAGAFTKIAAKTERLTRIIDNLLKLVNNDQFTTRMEKEPVDMRALILQAAADHRAFVTERHQQLILDVADNLPTLEVDRDKVEDALTNLLSNAIRFSPDGGTIRLSAHEVIGDMLEILVEDSGPGIPAESLANLFEPFNTGDIQHHHSGTFEYGSKGLGLGLAIVRRFIELHDGIVRAHVITRDGKTAGTQFQILLPLAQPEMAEEESPAKTDGD